MSLWEQGEEWAGMAVEGWMKRIERLIIRVGYHRSNGSQALELEKLVESRNIEKEESISLEWGKRQDS